MRTRWMVLVFLVLISHALLDAMTIYGTQLLWPLTDHPFGLGAIFIIDPLYTVPLLLGVLCALFMTRRRSRGHLLNRAGLAVSSLYLVWTLIAQSQADAVARRTLQANGVAFERILTIPAPLNTLLWRTIAILPDGRHYMIGYQSFLDGANSAIFERYPAGHTLAAQLAGHWPVDRLITFTKGFYRARLEGETLVVSDLRMGIEGRYAFEFEVGKRAGSSSELRVVPVPDKRKQEQRSTEGVGRLWARIWDPGVEIVPVATAGQ